MKIKILVFIFVVLALECEYCFGRSLANEDLTEQETSIRRKRSIADLLITDKKIKQQATEQRKRWIANILSKIIEASPADTSFKGKDCSLCFNETSKQHCICDVTEILRHMVMNKKEGKSIEISELKKLPQKLREAVRTKLHSTLLLHIRRFRKYIHHRRILMKFMVRTKKQGHYTGFRSPKVIIF